MKLFVWEGCLKTGAYHEDGSAVCIAATLKEAVALLPPKDGMYGYDFQGPAKKTPPTRVISVGDAPPQVILTNAGCDC